MGYDKKIRYLDYLEDGARVCGGGFLKAELSGNRFKLGLNVKGVRGAKELDADVILCGGGKEEVLGRIRLEDGQGELRQECQADSGIGGTTISCAELTGVRIPLGEGREIACRWGEFSGGMARQGSRREENIGAESVRQGNRREENTGAESVREEKHREENTGAEKPREAKEEERASAQVRAEKEAPVQGERQEIKLWEVKRPKERRAETRSDMTAQSHERRQESAGRKSAEAERRLESAGRKSAEAEKRSRNSGRQPEIVPLMEDKWLQLCAIYPHIKPFQDQREYLSIGPEDFVLFSSASYKAAGNSFMLHGYYNYRHLILAREERRGEILYYVGVPGNYFDREKQVAVMFGFESFECAQEPVQSADFGYYMMRVEL